MQHLCQKQGESVEDFYVRINMQVLKCKYVSEDVTQERILEQLIAGMTIQRSSVSFIQGWYPHSNTGVRHCKGTWGEHQAHEADTRSNTITSNINHWCGQQQQVPQAVWKLWQHSCSTQVPGIQYNTLPVPQEESPAPGIPLGQQLHSQHQRRMGRTCQSFNKAHEEVWMVAPSPWTLPPGNSHRRWRQRWGSCQQTGMSWILIHREEQWRQPWRTLHQCIQYSSEEKNGGWASSVQRESVLCLQLAARRNALSWWIYHYMPLTLR